ncbi:MAG: hypothetical protein ACFCU1_04475 [Sumerlaeia bacterium]
MPLSITELTYALDEETIISLTDDTNAQQANEAIALQASNAAAEEIIALLNGINDQELESGYLREIWITLTIERLFERRREATPQLWRERSQRARQYLQSLIKSNSTIPNSKLPSPLSSTRTPQERSTKPNDIKRY